MSRNKFRRPAGAALPLVFLGVFFVAAAAAPEEGAPRDAFASADELASVPVELESVTRDSFAAGAEYLPFPVAAVPFEAWALPGDKSLYLPLLPDHPTGSVDALAVVGDEHEIYGRASLFVGGYGPGEKRCVILMYHRFRAVPANKYEVSHADFRAQLEYIARNGYEVIPIDQLVEALQTHDPDLLPPRSVVITIDDGYRSAYDYAWPLLAAYEFPFAVYLYTDYINVGGKSMSWYEVRDLASDDLVTIGAHSMTHRNLANPRKALGRYENWVVRELTYPKVRLEAELGQPIRTFCWPYGSYNSYGVSVAIRAGYEGLLTVNAGSNNMNSSPFHLRRYGVYWHTPLSLFARILEGRPVTDDMWDYELATIGAEETFPIP
ncbi:MAG: polysaccharide deacetylase family protein [Candidatus Coatesbacteria bacterium]|nr:MAG: polysaccharide deacetylase family protein [Candidatus Coatesbacteria bacterium]